ncbi:MAG: IS3 family transposase [Christensenella sp.]
MCSFFEVSRSGYYAWVKREKETGGDLQLRNLIVECQQKNKRLYGYRRVRIWLFREYGIVINHKRVLRVMNKYGLLSVIRRKGYYRRMLSSELRYPNILDRDFKATAPNQKWCTDITYIKTKEGVLFLSAIKDLYDNYIVSYKTAASQDYGLVDRTLRAAVVNEGTHSGLILHSDQGSHYTTFSYKYFVDENDIIPSMSRPGTPLDNACAENFFSILKCECIYRQKTISLKEAQELVDEYIDYYNFERIQNKTGLTPYEQRQAAYAA